METKKRKVCGDTITSTVMETKKRKDYGDTITSTVMENKKYLPHDLIVEEILTKLPVPMLLKSVLVSKLWYNSIHNDHKHLTHSHFVQSQKQPQLVLSLLNIRVGFYNQTGHASYACYFFKFATTADHSHDNVLRFEKFRGRVAHPGIWEMVGYCNGLACMAQVGYCTTVYVILDPNRRRDLVCIFYPVKVGIRTPNSHIICHGFGFNSSANEYKLVSVFRTAQKELNFVVFTLGTKSWRDVTATTTPISGHGGRPITKIRAPTGSDKSAIFCTTGSSSSSGCLLWKIITTLGGAGSNDIQDDNSNEMEMLLSFNLDDEKFQLIQLPAKSSTNEQQKHALVDYPHLLEFKGSPCVARIEKKSENGSEYSHRCCGDHQGSSSSCCCCCCKVHLYVLKDKVRQVWVKEEIIDVSLSSTPTWSRDMGHLAPDPCCFCFSSASTPPTRILSFSGRFLLYWFDGIYLQVYDLHSGKLQLVLPSNNSKEHNIFHAKKKEPRHVLISGADDNMDYQLHCHEENFLSLETFIPGGVEGVAPDDFSQADFNRCKAYVSIYRGSEVVYPCFN